MNKIIFTFSLIFLSLNLQAKTNDHLDTVPYVNLKDYLGTWYEIARFRTHSFQKGCLQTKAEYSLKGHFIHVKNTCVKEDGKVNVAKALATVKDKQTNAKLKVSFVPILNLFGLFAGDYWILEVNEDEYSLVGTPDRKYLWILSRSKELDEKIYQNLVARAKELGFDTSLIDRTKTWE
ncbi:lipocalin family protein [Halobacteriovorax sp. GB3]|uniref:lipocalin family protein n=1 Tax=Halobacteriovorax sp. GB3 TaxID=2719615 RepID=UPI0023616239|nr:lipocalin family protein [Halobacteriovorax sp. GB3]MDD0854223.1 lipocalin family protein [Halobacteriovorax sp. GB3]